MAWSKTSQENTTRIDTGTSYIPVTGTAARSVCFAFKTSDTYAVNTYMAGWGDNSVGAAYRWRLDHGSSYRFRIEVNSGNVVFSTTSLNDGNWHYIAFGSSASQNIEDTVCYIDGASETVSSSSTRAINTGAVDPFYLGYDKGQDDDFGVYGPICEYAEVAVYNRKLTAGEMEAITKGVSPHLIPNGRILYWPLIRDVVSYDGNTVASISGSNYTISAHPKVIYPSAQILQFPPTAAGGVTGSVPDSLTITDTTTNTATIVALASDSLALSDTSSVVGTFVGTVSDSIVVTDEATGDLAGAITGAVPDAMSFTDTAAVTVNFLATASDSLGLTDTSSNTANRVAASDDSLALTDLIGLTQALSVAVNDLLNLTETLTGGEVGEKVYCAYYTFMSSAETAVIAELNADDLIREAGLTDELAAYGFMSDSDTVRIAAISAADTVVAATLLC